MRKLLVLIVLLAPMMSTVSADIDAEISNTCGNSEPVLSMSDPQKEYSHPGDLETYDQKLCVSGIESAEITEEGCERSTGFYISGRNREAHFSVFEAYNLHVCTGQMETRVTSSLGTCSENETELFSVSGRDNAHVAAPGVLDHLVCGSYTQPENLTISLDFNISSSDDVYYNGERLEGEESFSNSDFSYLVSESPSYVAGLVRKNILSGERRIESENSLKFTVYTNQSSFLVPFTSGDHSEIEDQEDQISENKFIDQVEPSFNFIVPEEPTVRLIYDPELNLSSSIDYLPGSHDIEIEKTGENKIDLNPEQ